MGFVNKKAVQIKTDQSYQVLEVVTTGTVPLRNLKDYIHTTKGIFNASPYKYQKLNYKYLSLMTLKIFPASTCPDI
jgi:hypothetical protein